MGFGKRKALLGLLALALGLLFAAPRAEAVTFQESIIGTGTSTSNNYYNGPLSSYYLSTLTTYQRWCLHSTMWDKAEMQAAGIPKGAVITNMEVYRQNTISYQDDIAKITMHLKNSGVAQFGDLMTYGAVKSGATKVIDGAFFNLPPVTGWMSLGNMTPFAYTGDTLEMVTFVDLQGFGSQPFAITSVASGPQWAYSDVFNRARGYGYNSTGTTNHTGNPPDTYTIYGSSSYNSGTYYYGYSRRINVRFTYYVPLTITTATPGPATGGVPYEIIQTSQGGELPYFWSVQRNQNAEWINIDAATGRVFGTPPKALGGLACNFTVRLTDNNGSGDFVEENYILPIAAVPTLPYSNNFELNLDGFKFTKFPGAFEAAWSRDSSASATPGGNGLLLDNTDTAGQAWELSPETDAANLAVADDPSQWFPGNSKDVSARHGMAELVFDAPKIKKLQIDFDYKIFNSSTSPGAAIRTNFIVEWSDNLGTSWNRAAGAGAMANGVYRGHMNSFAHQSILINNISGAQEFLMVRVRWLVRLSHNLTTIPNYVAIDNLVINSPLEVPYTTMPNAIETAPYNVLLQGAGGEPPYTNWKITQGALPVGVVLIKDGLEWYLRADALNIPTNAQGVYNFTLEVTDSTSAKATQAVTLNVSDQPPALNFANLSKLPSAGEGLPYSFTLTATGGVPFAQGYKWSILSTNAAWLDFTDTYSGTLSGLAPMNSAGQTVDITVRLEDAVGTTVDSLPQFTLDVVAEMQILTPTVLNLAPEGDTFREKLLAVGGQPPYQWSFLSGNFPIGVSLRPLEGKLVGAPARGQVGTFNFRLLVVDAGSQQTEKDFELEVAPASSNFFTITSTATLASVGEGNNFNADINATGGFPPYVWSILPGTAPPGLSVTSTGEITGTPTAGSAKVYTLSLRVTDANSVTATKQFSIEVLPDILPVSIITSTNLPTRREGTFYVQTISASGGSSPYVWTMIGGGLPNGVEFNQAGSSAVISGLPQLNSVGNYSVTLRVTDNIGQSADRTFSFVVDALPSGNALDIVWHSSNRVLPKGREGDSYGVTLQGTGGVPPYSFSLTPATTQPPAGISLNAFGAISGTPVGNTKGTYSFSIRIRDSIGSAVDRTFTLEVLSTEEDPNVQPDTTPAIGSFEAGGCAVATTSNKSILALLALMLGVAVLVSRRRRIEA